MILVKTKLGVSGRHGIGLFADQFIGDGTTTWQYHPAFDSAFDRDLIAQMSEPARAQFMRYAYFDYDLSKYVLCFDDQRFINHCADNPNIISTPRRIAAGHLILSRAKNSSVTIARMIKAGSNVMASITVIQMSVDFKMGIAYGLLIVVGVVGALGDTFLNNWVKTGTKSLLPWVSLFGSALSPALRGFSKPAHSPSASLWRRAWLFIPVFRVLFGRMYFADRLTTGQWIGIAFAVAALVLIEPKTASALGGSQ